MTVASGDEAVAGVVQEAVVVREAIGIVREAVVRGARLVQGIPGTGNFLALRVIRRIHGPGLAGRAGRITGSPGHGVTGARWPWRSPGRARPRHAIHVSERNRCNA